MPTIPNDVIAAAQASQERWGVPASVSIAQWALESAWGRSMSGKNNPFGIKAIAGQPATSRMTWEFLRGRYVKVSQPFRDFTDLTDAFSEHGRLLATSRRYAKARAFSPDARAYANALTGVYATAPTYGASLIAIIDANDLTRFDEVPRASLSHEHGV